LSVVSDLSAKEVAIGVGLVVDGFVLVVFCEAVSDGLGVEVCSLSLAHPDSPKPNTMTRLIPPAEINAFVGVFTFCIVGAYLPDSWEIGGHSGSHNLVFTVTSLKVQKELITHCSLRHA
jgi:hypothetical protein